MNRQDHYKYYMIETVSIGKKYNGEKAIISLTSWKARINIVSKTLFSLIKNCPDFHIVLNLSTDEFPKKDKDLPFELNLFINNNLIEVIWVKENLKPHKKYFYTMLKYKQIPIITVDDDHIAKNNIAEILYNSYKKNQKVIHAGRVHKILYSNKKIKPYNDWIWNYKKELNPSDDLFATGVGGILYPPDILKISENDLSDIFKCITADDIFLKYKEKKNNIKIKYVPNIIFEDLEDDIISETALGEKNWKNDNQNDYFINLFFK